MNETEKSSYVAANETPVKLMLSKDAVRNSVIHPVHVQLIPTNRCNSKCTWCSCKNVDRQVELGFSEICNIVDHFHALGLKAVTISGGGEPTLHPQINEILTYCDDLGIDCGMVTNGSRIDSAYIDTEIFNDVLTWLRLSVTDTEGNSYPIDRILTAASLLPDVDVGVSFTVTPYTNIELAKNILRMCEKLPNITHIRFVDEIINGSNGMMGILEKETKNLSTKAIYQRRNNYESGAFTCLISKLKPVIDATGLVYPCCGVQYAGGFDKQSLSMDPKMAMCHWSEYALETLPFCGSECVKCYYGGYQRALSNMLHPPHHHNFL